MIDFELEYWLSESDGTPKCDTCIHKSDGFEFCDGCVDNDLYVREE